MTQTSIEAPIGPLTIVANGRAIACIRFGKEPAVGPKTPVLRQAERELAEYFAGRRKRFTFPVEHSGTELQEKVWKTLAKIPFGETRSYADIAREIGSPRAVRAVGAANGKNPIAIVLACHRVIGSDGTLTGYGGGLPIKRWLLEHEAKVSS